MALSTQLLLEIQNRINSKITVKVNDSFGFATSRGACFRSFFAVLRLNPINFQYSYENIGGLMTNKAKLT